MNIKKYIKILFCIMFCVSFITSCKSDEMKIEDTKTTSKLENPFQIEKLKKEVGTEIIGRYGYGCVNPEERYIYDGEEVTIPIKWNNIENELEVGVMLFVDGEPQEILFKENKDEDKKYLKSIKLPESSSVIKTIKFKPNVGKAGDVLKINIVSMLNPSYLPIEDKETFNVNHSLLDLEPIELEYKVDSENQKTNTMIVSNSFMTEENRSSLKIEEDPFNQILIHSKGESRYENGSLLMGNEDKDLNLKLSAFGDELSEFKTTVFVNHEPVISKCDGEYYNNYKLSIQKDYLASIDFSIDKKYMKSNNNFIYAISIPVGKNSEIQICLKECTRLIKFDKDISNKSELKNIIEKDDSNRTFEETTGMDEQIEKTIFSNLFSIVGSDDENLIYAISYDNELVCLDLNKHEKIGILKLDGKKMHLYKYMIFDDGLAIAIKNNDNKENRSTICRFYDSKLNYKNEIDLSKIANSKLSTNNLCISEDGKKIIFIDDRGKSIYSYNIEFKKKELLKTLENNDLISRFNEIEYKNNIIGFKTSEGKDGKRTNYIGKINTQNSEMSILEFSKGIDHQIGDIQIANGLLLFHDINICNSNDFSGNAVLGSKDGFELFKLKNKDESGYVCLSNDGKKIATYCDKNKKELFIRVYDIEKKELIYEISLDKIEGRQKLDMNLQSDKLFVVYGKSLREYDLKNMIGSVVNGA